MVLDGHRINKSYSEFQPCYTINYKLHIKNENDKSNLSFNIS